MFPTSTEVNLIKQKSFLSKKIVYFADIILYWRRGSTRRLAGCAVAFLSCCLFHVFDPFTLLARSRKKVAALKFLEGEPSNKKRQKEVRREAEVENRQQISDASKQKTTTLRRRTLQRTQEAAHDQSRGQLCPLP